VIIIKKSGVQVLISLVGISNTCKFTESVDNFFLRQLCANTATGCTKQRSTIRVGFPRVWSIMCNNIVFSRVTTLQRPARLKKKTPPIICNSLEKENTNNYRRKRFVRVLADTAAGSRALYKWCIPIRVLWCAKLFSNQ